MGGLLGCVAALFAASFFGFLPIRRHSATFAVYGACFAISIVLCALSIPAIAAPASSALLPLGLPWLGAHFRLDALAAVFLAIVDLGAAVASFYALGYGTHESEPRRVLPFYPIFLASMNLVILAADAYSFLFAWELMSLTSWALVMSRHREAATARAGFVYLLMASFGTFALLLAFGILAGPDGAFAFDAIQARPLSPAISALVLALVLVGAGSKAGLVPLHVWLPLAHPAAPSHVSALMSGAMTKVAVYAFIRISFDLMGPPAWWWSLPLLLLGGITAAAGVLYALMETDLKRVLAYSNIGIIFAALGLALAFKACELNGAAALVLTAALFHAFNHMLFKSGLFFGAGAVIVATGEKDMERLGGLIHRMPISSGAFLIACLAIAALPPFNGFASEWLIFQGVLVSPQLPQMGLKLLVPAIGVLLALSAALAAACFVRAFGMTYLGRARSKAASEAREADRWSLTAMTICAALCLLTGIFPGLVIDALQPAALALVAGHMPAQTANAWLSIVPVSASRSSYNGLMIFGFLGISVWLSAALIHRFASRAVRRAPFWDCGYPGAGPIAQYSATSLAQPLRRVFGSVALGTYEEVEMAPPGDTAPARLRRFIRDPIWDFAYAPLAGGIGWVATLLNHLQYLTIRRYLSFVFTTLVLLLSVLAIWG